MCPLAIACRDKPTVCPVLFCQACILSLQVMYSMIYISNLVYLACAFLLCTKGMQEVLACVS